MNMTVNVGKREVFYFKALWKIAQKEVIK